MLDCKIYVYTIRFDRLIFKYLTYLPDINKSHYVQI